MPFEFLLVRKTKPSPWGGLVKSVAMAGFCALWMSQSALAANGPDTIKQLIQSGQLDQAFKTVQQERQTAPKDVQLQFLEAVILAQQGQHDRAIDAFRKLTEMHPELPEPYNNLGVLYAAKGRLEEARMVFEKAIQTHASYSAAHHNLADVQAQLVRQTYARALQADPKVKVAPTQLTLLGAITTERTDVTKLTSAADRPAPLPVPAPVLTPSSPPAMPISTPLKTAAEVEKEAAKEATKDSLKQAPEKHKEQNAEEEAVKSSIQSWAHAWSQKDIKKYFSAYASNFEPPDHLSRSKWEVEREQRIVSKKKIQVVLSNFKIDINGNKAKINFSQMYESDNFKGSSRKSLELTKQSGRWLITRETVN
jgi:tetratricopeptide (TPR) repeat protein